MKRTPIFIQLIITVLFAAMLLSGCRATGEEKGAPVTEEGIGEENVLVGEAPGGEADTESGPESELEEIVVLYTNDVHCAAGSGIGYAGVAAMKEDLAKTHSHVVLVDCGDHCQGGTIGFLSKGNYPIQIMNQAGYDYAVPGNHEFDYGLEVLRTNMLAAEFRYLACNVTYIGTGSDPFFGMAPYEIVDYDGTKVAYIGVTTPDTEIKTNRKRLEENGTYAVDFHGETINAFCKVIQENVDACRAQGAQYVILLGHLGTDQNTAFNSEAVIRGTEGIDAVLDAHSHTRIEEEFRPNKNGEKVLLTSTGNAFRSVGQLIIAKDGTVTSRLFDTYDRKDKQTQALVDNIEKACEEETKQVVGSTAYPLMYKDNDGIRMIRSRETNLGDLISDAVRTGMDSGITLVNSGSIRAGIAEGDITRGDVLNVLPLYNEYVTVRLKGSALLDALEMGVSTMEKEYAADGNAVGENAAFFQVSGLRYTVKLSVPSSVETDEKGCFVRVAGEYRVRDVFVETAEGELEPLDPELDYAVTTTTFLQQGGDGMAMLKDSETLSEAMPESDLLEAYIRSFPDGKIPKKYRSSQGRITVR